MKNKITIGIGTKLRSIRGNTDYDCIYGCLCQTSYKAISYISLKCWDPYNRFREAVVVGNIRDITADELYQILGDLSQWQIKIGKNYRNLQKIVESV